MKTVGGRVSTDVLVGPEWRDDARFVETAKENERIVRGRHEQVDSNQTMVPAFIAP